MSLDQSDLEYLAEEIPRLTAPYPAPVIPPADEAVVYAVQARWNEEDIRARGVLSSKPLQHAAEWLAEPKPDLIPDGEPWAAGVTTMVVGDVPELEQEFLVIVLSRAYRREEK